MVAEEIGVDGIEKYIGFLDILCCGLSGCIFSCVGNIMIREKIRKKDGFSGGFCGDCCAACCCLPCSECQTYNHAFDSWVFDHELIKLQLFLILFISTSK